MTCYCIKCKQSRERWRIANKDKINTRRRELRAIKSKEVKQGRCLLCEILLRGNSHGTQVYCRSCVDKHKTKVNRDKCNRSYQRSKVKK